MAIYAQISDKTIKSIKQVFFTTVLDALGVSYKKLGRESVTLCPWHNDSNPSLTISDEKSFCYCFVCAKKGDIIEFVKGYDSLSFSDAVLKIASVSNITVEYDNIDLEKADKERELRKRLIDQVQSNQDYYLHTNNDLDISILDFLTHSHIKREKKGFLVCFRTFFSFFFPFFSTTLSVTDFSRNTQKDHCMVPYHLRATKAKWNPRR